MQILIFHPNAVTAKENKPNLSVRVNDVSLATKLKLALSKPQSSKVSESHKNPIKDRYFIKSVYVDGQIQENKLNSSQKVADVLPTTAQSINLYQPPLSVNSTENQNRLDEVDKISSPELEEHQPDFSYKVADALPTTAQNVNLEQPQTLENETKHQTQINKNFQNPSKIVTQVEESILNFSYKADDLLPITKYNVNFYQLQSPETIKEELTQTDSLYKIQPKIVPKEKVPPILTTFTLNDMTINHFTKEVVDGYFVFGDERSENYYINGLYQIDSRVVQSLSQDNVFTSDFKADYVSVQTINNERKVSLSYLEPQTLRGFETQQTFIGPCELINDNISESNQQCTFLPPLVVDRNSIEPQFFVPTRIEQMGKIGDVISPETLAILKQPGWQNIGANGEITGVDIYFPNIGATPGNSQSNQSSISRREDIDTTYSLGYYRVRQIVKANAQEAVLGRTIRGIGVVIDDENSLLHPLLGAAAEILPDIEPSLQGLPQDANTNINKNLFNAANNIRIPQSSFVIYQAGMGAAEHTKKNTNNPQAATNTSRRIPSAIFNSIWLGMSPVTQRSFSQNYRYVSTAEERQIMRAGGEGGIDSDISFILATNENSIASADLNNFYIQAYISFLERNVNFVTSTTLTEKTNYYPHLSFTGNITTYNSVFRYYTGAIAAQDLKLYVGADYTRYWDNWLFNLSAITYYNGNKDYFSKTEGSLSKQFKLNPVTNLNLFTEFRYAWEHNKDNFLDNPIDNFLSIGTSIDFKKFSLRVSQLLDLFPDSIGNKLQASLNIPLGSNASLTAYLSPQKNINSYGISAQYTWRNSSTTSNLIFSWNRNIYDFGNDSFGKDLETTNDTFTFLFKATFK